jgi:hypothetical protein
MLFDDIDASRTASTSIGTIHWRHDDRFAYVAIEVRDAAVDAGDHLILAVGRAVLK